ncbi:MAG: hypothetical protein A2144_03775 [Chloroflexi bacterium RBG_16_50_9]|nr:MAG: hypothetical protein A2144_03775 [Chloroflexi bacterium RBG_16_50_9]
MEINFNKNAPADKEVATTINKFLQGIDTLEKEKNLPVFIYQDGVKNSYYIRCTISGETMSNVISLDARLDPQNGDTFRDNRELLLKHNTFLRMKADATNGREFNDIIVEYNTSYLPEKPLKVWGGQHRAKAIIDAFLEKKTSRYHGFRVYFCLTKEQRTELAFVSNTNIAVSNDIFDRQLEETLMGPHLRRWCVKVGLLKQGEDFPDVGGRAERITTQSARSFIVNYFKGKQTGEQLSDEELDRNVYEPYLCQTGIVMDEEYRQLIEQKENSLWSDKKLLEAGKALLKLHSAQYEAIKQSNLDRRSFRIKALAPAVLSAWAYVTGLLQSHPARLNIHFTVPNSPKGAPDPLNAEEMSLFKTYQDPDAHRGLGIRSILKDRQRMAQVFLARTIDPEATLDKKLITQAVNQVTALRFFSKGYTA